MANVALRRNHSLASCEPCRRGKVRCDHEKPVCASCRRRGRGSQCWYHPAPMTKGGSQRSTLQAHPSNTTSESRIKERVNASENSYVEAPNFHSWPFMFNDSKSPITPASTLGALDTKTRDEYLLNMEEIISAIKFLPVIEKHFHAYFSFSQGAMVQKPIILELARLVRASLESSGLVIQETAELICLESNGRLAQEMLRSSSSEVALSPVLNVEEFCALFWGKNLRVETLGLLYAVAARSHLYRYSDNDSDEDFIIEMNRCSNLSLRLARDLAPQTTDLIIWLAHENLQFTAMTEGEASLSVWRRMGDLATDLFALGLNRESTYSPDFIPFFLAESRRRMFSKAYYLDKMFAMMFLRPPRIATRHADCKPPLELSDDEMFSNSPNISSQARKSLTNDGWNTDGRCRPTTWARVRYILGEFREDIVEYQIQLRRYTDNINLKNLATRCHGAWIALPSHTRYNKEIWTSNIPPEVCFMQGKVYLAYLLMQFQILRLLGEGSTTSSPELLDISADMLETTIEVANPRGRASYFPRDLPGILLSYGLPSAAILIKALEKTNTNSTDSLPIHMKPSNLIRNLSVLVSHLENACGAGGNNHAFCIQASKAIAKKLDNILNEPTISAVSSSFEVGVNTSSQAIPTSGMSVHAPPGGDELDLFDMQDLDGFDGFDLANWVMDVN